MPCLPLCDSGAFVEGKKRAIRLPCVFLAFLSLPDVCSWVQCPDAPNKRLVGMYRRPVTLSVLVFVFAPTFDFCCSFHARGFMLAWKLARGGCSHVRA